MNPQEIQQVAAHDEKWVPSGKRVKISSTNIRLKTIMPQNEETFQVVIDIIRNSTCFKAFTISADVLEIFMQQFWYTIKKVQDIDSYEFLLANKNVLSMLKSLGQSLISVQEIVSRFKFVKIGEDYQEYGLPILDVMLTDAIKYSKSYQMFVKYSINQISPKKSRGKGLKGKKTTKESHETIDVSEESELEPEPEQAKKKTSSKKDQNEAEEAEAARKVHATHSRIVTESVPESAKKKSGDRSSKSVVIQDTLSTLKSKPTTSKTNLKALKESKKTSKRQPGTEGSNKGTGSKPGVPDESTVIFVTSSEGTGAKPGVLNKEKDITKEKVILDDTQVVDDEDDETKSDEDEIYKYKIHMRKDEDVEMKDAEVKESDKGEEKVNDAAKKEAKKTSEAKDDNKKTKLLPSSSSLYVSLGFGDQFLKLSSDSSLVSTVKDSADTDAQIRPIFLDGYDVLGFTDTVKDNKRKRDDDEDDDDDDDDPPAVPNQSKKTKRRRTKESEFSKRPSTTKETPKEEVEKLLDEGMLVSLGNHLLVVMWMRERESDEFVLNHEGDKNNSEVSSLKGDLTIKVQNKTRENWLINFIETIETNVRKETIDMIRGVVKLINDSTIMNTSIFDGFVEVNNRRRDTGCLGDFGNVGTGKRGATNGCSRHVCHNRVCVRHTVAGSRDFIEMVCLAIGFAEKGVVIVHCVSDSTVSATCLLVQIVTWISELTSIAGSELDPASYRLFEDKILATCEQELCAFGFLLASCQVSSNELRVATYRTTKDTLGTTPEGGVLLGPERPRTYDDLNDNEKKRFNANVRATNILLQGLPKDIYKLNNHNIEAKAIWDNVKMLLTGSELTKEDRES
uniref:Integrase, catalytic region, zinc finger, CCHC-type, peptidase aspartic, catalytic n=1 Tax=Tanacetum cinerariifolium TaxID=118510 RepID=A0A6L2JGT8_TANCI|nr:integrase, catalytic region, zinc finger, CCHC-type, peptidase aspartic, catalytic [Tanacetum cinerariifolium]